MALTPTPADKFSFGLWTIGYNGADPFGGPTRAPMDIVHVVTKLKEVGAYGLTFHDDDLFAFGSSDADRQKQIDRLKGALADTGLIIPMVTTNGLVAFSKNNYPYYWRLTPSDDANGAAFAVWAVRKGYKNVAVVFQNGIGSEGNLPGVRSAMPKLGGKLGLQLTIPADSASYSSEVAKVIAAKPGALIWSADPQTTATFMSEYKQLNNGALPAMITATDSLTPDFFNALTKVVGTNYVTHDVYLVGSSFSQTTPAFKIYKGALSADPKTSAIANVLSAVGPPASIYDGINILALAMIMSKSTVGSTYNSDITKVVAPKPGAVVVDNYAAGKQALAAGKQIQYVGVLGPVVFNKYHNSAGMFAAAVFAANGSANRVGAISGPQVLGLL